MEPKYIFHADSLEAIVKANPWNDNSDHAKELFYYIFVPQLGKTLSYFDVNRLIVRFSNRLPLEGKSFGIVLNWLDVYFSSLRLQNR